VAQAKSKTSLRHFEKRAGENRDERLLILSPSPLIISRSQVTVSLLVFAGYAINFLHFVANIKQTLSIRNNKVRLIVK
jgi:hypothetical protein